MLRERLHALFRDRFGLDLTDDEVRNVAFHKPADDTPEMEYLRERCILSPEAINTFKLGWSNRTLGYRVPTTTSQGKKLKDQLQTIGILRDSGHEHFCGCVTFPVYNAAGDVVALRAKRSCISCRERI